MADMSKLQTIFAALVFLLTFGTGFTQEDEAIPPRYKAVVGIGYLHTQVQLIVENWEIYPLNNIPLDEFEEEWQQHMVEELEHDEEWADYMLEDNTLFGAGEVLPDEVEEAINANLEFYHDVISLLRTPGELTKKIKLVREEMADASERLYEVILPALVK